MKYCYHILLTVCCLFLFSCGRSEKQALIPADVLPKDKMAEVITDIHIAEAEANMRTLPDSASTENLSFQKIFEAHGISKEQYEKSLSFYMDHPQQLDTVYQNVLNELSKMQGKASKQ